MHQNEIEVLVADGTRFIERAFCSQALLPNGDKGVVWRGVAYRILPGDRIDVGETVEVRPSGPNHAVIPGEEASWVLLQGLAPIRDDAQARLEAAGINVTRSGRWLGEAVNGADFDWFLRCEGARDPAHIAVLLGAAPAADTVDDAVRATLLEHRLGDLLAELARLEAALARAMRPPASAHAAPSSAVDIALREALAEVAELRSHLAEAPVRVSATNPSGVRLREEIAAMLFHMRPDIDLARDSLIVASGELTSRAGFYRAIAELPASGTRPDGWKMLRGADRWWERHVSTGRDDAGRAYARFDPVTRRWSFLLG